MLSSFDFEEKTVYNNFEELRTKRMIIRKIGSGKNNGYKWFWNKDQPNSFRWQRLGCFRNQSWTLWTRNRS